MAGKLKSFYLAPLFQNKHLYELQRHFGNTEAYFRTSADILNTALCIYYISCITVSEADVFIFFMRFPADDRLYAALFFIYLGNVGKASYVLYLVVIFPGKSGSR